jgi:hypothetical protein
MFDFEFHLKSKASCSREQTFAILDEPPFPDVHNDAELYACVRRYGSAVARIIHHLDDGTRKLGDRIVLKPRDFEAHWRGD